MDGRSGKSYPVEVFGGMIPLVPTGGAKTHIFDWYIIHRFGHLQFTDFHLCFLDTVSSTTRVWGGSLVEIEFCAF